MESFVPSEVAGLGRMKKGQEFVMRHRCDQFFLVFRLGSHKERGSEGFGLFGISLKVFGRYMPGPERRIGVFFDVCVFFVDFKKIYQTINVTF